MSLETALEALPGGQATRRSSGRDRPISVTVWLWCLVGCVFAMVVVGGATRLTQSGLSITEWKPIDGVIPPLSQADWSAAFADYRNTPQFQHLFPDMTLAQFKGIFMWEWSHRLLGRLIGFIVALPLVWFWWTKRIDTALARGLAVVLVLGGLQGVLGWLMVESGLVGRVEVAPEILAAHLVLASILFVVLVAIAVGPPRSEARETPLRLRRTARALPLLILAQLALGAFVAGSRAGLVYNTWPLMDGGLAPGVAHLFAMSPAWRNWFENVALVQFDHRMMAYAIFGIAVWHAIDAHRSAPGTAFARRAATFLLVVLIQIALGVTTLLLAAPVWAGLLHQAFAMVVLMKATVHWRRSVPSRRPRLTLVSAQRYA